MCVYIYNTPTDVREADGWRSLVLVPYLARDGFESPSLNRDPILIIKANEMHYFSNLF